MRPPHWFQFGWATREIALPNSFPSTQETRRGGPAAIDQFNEDCRVDFVSHMAQHASGNHITGQVAGAVDHRRPVPSPSFVVGVFQMNLGPYRGPRWIVRATFKN